MRQKCNFCKNGPCEVKVLYYTGLVCAPTFDKNHVQTPWYRLVGSTQIPVVLINNIVYQNYEEESDKTVAEQLVQNIMENGCKNKIVEKQIQANNAR